MRILSVNLMCMLCRKRVEKVPGYVAKKNWNEITTELTRFTYTLRESMLR
jgi:hypothetical protein